MPPNESAAKAALKSIIEGYHVLSAEDKKAMSEASVVRQFIDRLLSEVLGWPIKDPTRYKYELVTEAGRPDLTLFPEAGGVIFVEAKRFGIIEELKEARKAISGVTKPGQLALTGMAVDRTAQEQQAINYAFENNGTWAILTNFEKLRLFNARRDWLVLDFNTPDALLSNFDLLWQLTYHNIVNGSLDRLSNQRLTADIDTPYLQFINEWREKLAQNILTRRAQNAWAFDADGSVDLVKMRAVVQRLIDRLVVIRFAEDHLVIPPGSLRVFYDMRQQSQYAQLSDMLPPFFRRFDETHNSALFAPDLVDRASFGDEVLFPLLERLYQARYRSMPADIMGNTYEQYLGKALVSDGSTIRTSDNLETRKKQGSYYTPQVLVRYIVDQSLGRYLYGTEDGKPGGALLPDEARKTSRDLRDLRVLDGACGSGSFLIYAYQVLAEFYQGEIARRTAEVNATIDALAAANTDPIETRLQAAPLRAEIERIQDYPRLILEQHLYGVDLDPQAAEIAVVNLMMRAMEGQSRADKRLPLLLNQNIKIGNALVGLPPKADYAVQNVSAAELRDLIRLRRELLTVGHGERHDALLRELPAATRALAERLDVAIRPHFTDLDRVRPFHWGVEFPEAFYDAEGASLANSGFAVIIGNPPYGGELSNAERVYMTEHYGIGTTDTAALFTKRALELLTKDGYHGFVVPKPLTYSSTSAGFRKLIENGLYDLIDCGEAWDEVLLEQIIYMYTPKPQEVYKSSRVEKDLFVSAGTISKKAVRDFGFFLNNISSKEIEIAEKIRSTGTFLNQYLANTRGAGLQRNSQSNATGKRVIGGRNIQPYRLNNDMGRLPDNFVLPANAVVQAGDILVQNVVAHIMNPVDHIKIIGCVAGDDANQLAILDTVNCFSNKSQLSSHFLLALLMSQVVNWYVYRFIYARAVRTMHFDNPVTSRIPIPAFDLTQAQDRLHYDEIIRLVATKQKTAIPDKHIDDAIQQHIFALYKLPDEDIQLIQMAMPASK